MPKKTKKTQKFSKCLQKLVKIYKNWQKMTKIGKKFTINDKNRQNNSFFLYILKNFLWRVVLQNKYSTFFAGYLNVVRKKSIKNKTAVQ